MKQYKPSYFIGQAFRGIWRNGVMSFASIAVLMSCLVVLGSFALLVMNINENLNDLGLMNEVMVFLEFDLTEEQINNRNILRNIMIENGFKPLDTEWWHFTLENEPYPDTYFDFPVSEDSVPAA